VKLGSGLDESAGKSAEAQLADPPVAGLRQNTAS
jgi:hypothetical protein